jgi:hypothetical protein
MKTHLSLTLALGLGWQSAFAQIVVHDPINHAALILNHLEQIIKLVETIRELRETKDRLGDAAAIRNVPGAAQTLALLGKSGIGKSRTELATLAKSSLGVAYDGQGLYQAVGRSFLSRDGQAVTRPDVFKPEAAIFQAVANHDAVQEDVTQRRRVLRAALRSTVSQLQAATTHAEVQKLTGIMIAEVAELEAIDRELDASARQVALLDIQNRANKERQQKAANQEQTREMTESLRHFVGALKPPTFISARP